MLRELFIIFQPKGLCISIDVDMLRRKFALFYFFLIEIYSWKLKEHKTSADAIFLF